jgi:hypothetical protein
LVCAFHSVVHGASRFIGSGKASFFRRAFSFLFASVGDMFGQDRSFLWAQFRRSVLFVCGFRRMNLGLVVFDLACRFMLRHRGSSRFNVLFSGRTAILPLRKRLAGQRFQAGRK